VTIYLWSYLLRSFLLKRWPKYRQLVSQEHHILSFNVILQVCFPQLQVSRVGQNHIRCVYGVFGREITRYTVIYVVCIQFWPTLQVSHNRVWESSNYKGSARRHRHSKWHKLEICWSILLVSTSSRRIKKWLAKLQQKCVGGAPDQIQDDTQSLRSPTRWPAAKWDCSLTFRCRMILVPLPSCSPSMSRATVKLPPAWDSHTYCSSSLCLVTTVHN